jgi:hypothetical protein
LTQGSDPTGVPVSSLEAPHRKKSPILLFIALVLLSLVSVLAIYLFLQVRTLTLENTASSPTPIPVASADPTLDWETFTHPVQKYSLRFPTHLQVKVDESTPANSIFVISDNPVYVIGGVEVRELNISPEQWINSEKKSGVEIFDQQNHTTPFTSGIKIKAAKAVDYYAFIVSHEDMLYIVSLNITGNVMSYYSIKSYPPSNYPIISQLTQKQRSPARCKSIYKPTVRKGIRIQLISPNCQ